MTAQPSLFAPTREEPRIQGRCGMCRTTRQRPQDTWWRVEMFTDHETTGPVALCSWDCAQAWMQEAV